MSSVLWSIETRRRGPLLSLHAVGGLRVLLDPHLSFGGVLEFPNRRNLLQFVDGPLTGLKGLRSMFGAGNDQYNVVADADLAVPVQDQQFDHAEVFQRALADLPQFFLRHPLVMFEGDAVDILALGPVPGRSEEDGNAADALRPRAHATEFLVDREILSLHPDQHGFIVGGGLVGFGDLFKTHEMLLSMTAAAGEGRQQGDLITVLHFKVFVRDILIDRHEHLLFLQQFADLRVGRVDDRHQVLHPPAFGQRQRKCTLIAGQHFRHAEEPHRHHLTAPSSQATDQLCSHGNRALIGAGFPARFRQQADVAEAHAPVHRLAHVINR
ncbi:hypothetical protein NSPZN2_50185 [Nitrospira defluvii]|uniref:Uncharacterized protein n=1 Tax=Nitrospira defluvii TaxID=330214 RepID=A0ABM8S4B6_9BACT|nr:hypothetical protein NSPZN2_50185 [Nitrospira defluvii]